MARHQVGGQLVGLARRRAVADRDQLHAVPRAQRRQRAQRAVPVLARLVRVDRRGLQELAGAVDDRDLHAGADARVEPHRDALAGRRGQQQIVQVACRRPGSLRPRPARAAAARSRSRGAASSLNFQVHRTVSAQPGVGRRGRWSSMPARAGDAPLGLGRAGAGLRPAATTRQPQDAFLAAAQQRQRAVRRDAASPARWHRSSRRTSRPPPPCPATTVDRNSPRFQSSCAQAADQLGDPRRTVSIRIQRAPSSAAAASATPCSALT